MTHLDVLPYAQKKCHGTIARDDCACSGFTVFISIETRKMAAAVATAFLHVVTAGARNYGLLCASVRTSPVRQALSIGGVGKPPEVQNRDT